MNWTTFIQSLEKFFTSVGQIFLQNIDAAIPIAEQAVVNFLTTLADTIVADIENGTIPLPVLAAEPGVTPAPVDPAVLGRVKQAAAVAAIQAQLVKTPAPNGVVVTSSLINFVVELSVQKVKAKGNGGNFPGGNTGPVAA